MSAQRQTRSPRPLPDPVRQRVTALKMLTVFLFYFVGLIQIIFAMRWNLSPDEAFYWLLSRHLRMGYLDHPPAIAWIIHFTTSLIGSTEVGVRTGMILMALGAILILLRLCRLLLKEVTAYWLLMAIGLTSPLLTGIGLIATPDTPAMFFSTVALAIAVVIALRLEPAEPVALAKKKAPPLPPVIMPLWFCFGVFCGLALLSKYTAILLPASVFLAFLTSPTGRRELRQPGIYLSAIVALLVFSPVLIWNYDHHWISFTYQWQHGLDTAAVQPGPLRTTGQLMLHHLLDFGEFLGGQLVIWTPVLFILGAVAFIHYARRYRALPLAWRMLVWSAIFPLAFFGVAATHKHGELNWPGFAYIPLSLLTVGYVAENYRGARGGWARIGIIVALIINIVLHAPELIFKGETLFAEHVLKSKKTPAIPKKLSDFYGWKQLGKSLDTISGNVIGNPYAPVICATHEDAGEASFYMIGQPDVWSVSLGADARPTSFDYLDETPPWKDSPYVVLVNFGKNWHLFCDQYGYTKMPIEDHWVVYVFGHERDRPMIICQKETPSSAPAIPATMPVAAPISASR